MLRNEQEIHLEHLEEIDRLRAAIRKHRDFRGDSRCWLDDEELYKTLPEGYTPPLRDAPVELENCKRYIAYRHNPKTEYVSPDLHIAKLRIKLRLADRVMREIVKLAQAGDIDSRSALADAQLRYENNWPDILNEIDTPETD